MWYVYILECNDGSFYTGITDDVPRRLQEHKARQGGKYTRSRGGAKRILYTEKHATKKGAMRREAAIKTWPREKKMSFIQFGNPTRN